MPTNVIVPADINSRSGDETVAVWQSRRQHEDRNGSFTSIVGANPTVACAPKADLPPDLHSDYGDQRLTSANV